MEPRSRRELSRHSGLSVPGTHAAVDRLEQSGIVEVVGAGGHQRVRIRTAHPLHGGSTFHTTHGFYVHGLTIDAAILPAGWERRTIRVASTGGRRGECRERRRARKAHPADGSEMNGKTVLLVEDNEDSREIYGTVLRHQGYRVLLAESGPDGLTAAREHLPDAVVLDLGLPEMDGVEVVRHLREDPATARIPILVLTVHGQESDRAGAAQAGCDRYILKPADPAGVGEEIGRLLGVPG